MKNIALIAFYIITVVVFMTTQVAMVNAKAGGTKPVTGPATYPKHK